MPDDYQKVYGFMELEAFLGRLRLEPKIEDERLEELKQQYETVLCMLESDFLTGIVTGNWEDFDNLIKTFRGNE